MRRSKGPELHELADILRERFKDEIREILFFGSRVRGDYSPESDYDCLLIFQEVTPVLKDKLDRLTAAWLLDRGIVFSWVAISVADLDRLRFEPFLQNARREGIAA